MRFFLGDNNGQLKSIRCTKLLETDWKVDVSMLDDGGRQGKTKGIQRLAVQGDKVFLGRCDGSAALFAVEEAEDSVRVVHQWEEARFKPGEKYVGLGLTTDVRMISCTNAGRLRLTQASVGAEDGVETSQTTSQTTFIPNRLCEWMLSEDSQSFAYGGDEVEVSVWDTSRALDPSRQLLPSSAVGTKRKKGKTSELFDGEIWRAQNVANDFLNLRQPVHNTSLTYLPHTSGGVRPCQHILAGTRIGSVRRYDTRVARKPVADWQHVGRVGGVQTVQRGNFEHEAFIADHGGNLVALDLRTGRVLYAYSGLAGAISSMAPTLSSLSPPLLASASLDRFFRLHTTYDPRNTLTDGSNRKGEILAKIWVKSAVSCVAWDGKVSAPPDVLNEQDEHEHDIWAELQDVGEENDTSTSVSNSTSRLGGSDGEDVSERKSTTNKKKKVR